MPTDGKQSPYAFIYRILNAKFGGLRRQLKLMKKLISLLVLAVIASLATRADVAINSTNFPDDNFREYLISRYPDGRLTDSDIARCKTLDVRGMNIASLTGLKYFTAITKLDCYNNPNLTTIDGIQYCTALEEIMADNCGLTSLDVTGLNNLAILRLRYNKLTTFSVSGLSQLYYLRLQGNTSLTEVYCPDNNLTELDVTECLGLQKLICNNNPRLTSITGLIGDNKITHLECSNCALISVDATLKQLKKLEYLSIGNNSFAKLEIAYMSNLHYLSVAGSTQLTELYANENSINSLDVSDCTALNILECSGNPLGSLDVSKCPALVKLFCTYDQLTSLDVSHNAALENLICNNNQLTSLDVKNNLHLQTLVCQNNLLTSLDVEGLPELATIYCENNQLTSMNVQYCPELFSIRCFGNQLTTIDLSKTPGILDLRLHRNNINGAGMDNMINSLPTRPADDTGTIFVRDKEDNNVMSPAQLALAKAKNWKVLYYRYPGWYNMPDYFVGDVDEDGLVNIADVTALIDLLLKDDTAGHPAADVDEDSIISIADASALIDTLIN